MILRIPRLARSPGWGTYRARCQRLLFAHGRGGLILVGAVLGFFLHVFLRSQPVATRGWGDWALVLFWSADPFLLSLTVALAAAFQEGRTSQFFRDFHLTRTPLSEVLAPMYDFVFGIQMIVLAVEAAGALAFQGGAPGGRAAEFAANIILGVPGCHLTAGLLFLMNTRRIGALFQAAAVFALGVATLGAVSLLSASGFSDSLVGYFMSHDGHWMVTILTGPAPARVGSAYVGITLAWYAAYALLSAVMLAGAVGVQAVLARNLHRLAD